MKISSDSPKSVVSYRFIPSGLSITQVRLSTCSEWPCSPNVSLRHAIHGRHVRRRQVARGTQFLERVSRSVLSILALATGSSHSVDGLVVAASLVRATTLLVATIRESRLDLLIMMDRGSRGTRVTGITSADPATFTTSVVLLTRLHSLAAASSDARVVFPTTLSLPLSLEFIIKSAMSSPCHHHVDRWARWMDLFP